MPHPDSYLQVVSHVSHTDEDGNIQARRIVTRPVNNVDTYYLQNPLAARAETAEVPCKDYDHAVTQLTNWIAEIHGFAITGIRG